MASLSERSGGEDGDVHVSPVNPAESIGYLDREWPSSPRDSSGKRSFCSFTSVCYVVWPNQDSLLIAESREGARIDSARRCYFYRCLISRFWDDDIFLSSARWCNFKNKAWNINPDICFQNCKTWIYYILFDYFFCCCCCPSNNCKTWIWIFISAFLV